MEYLSSRRSSMLSNDPLIITLEDIKTMHLQNKMDALECRAITESSNRKETYYADDSRPGLEKMNNFQRAFFKELMLAYK